MKLIAGLGNLGNAYKNTRHNIGYLVIDHLSEKNQIPLQKRRFKSIVGYGTIASHEVILAKPLTFMNLSGEAVSTIIRYYKIDFPDLMIVHDDIDLAFGRIKIKTSGGSGGHRGIDSIITYLKSKTFTRIRVGIGRPSEGNDPSDFVLLPFNKDEQIELPQVINRAEQCVETCLTQSYEAAMNVFNTKRFKKPGNKSTM